MPESKPYVVVVGIDYSETSDLALERALDLAAERPHAEVHVLHVLPAYQPGFTPEGAVAGVANRYPDLSEASTKLLGHVDRILAERAAQGRKTPERVVTHLRLEVAANEVAQLAADLEADLVVVGTHGRRGVSRLLLGSVAEATVRLAPCPVLVVRKKAPPQQVPQIEPPCPNCLAARRESGGAELWCEQHRERHGQRHTYYQSDRVGAETNLPLLMRS